MKGAVLSEQERLEAETKLKLLEKERELNDSIKNKIKDHTATIKQLTELVRNGPEPLDAKITILSKLTSETLPAAIVDLEMVSSVCYGADERYKDERDKMVRERIRNIDEKEKTSKQIENIKSTIAAIQKTVQESKEEEAKKRAKIEEDLEKSLEEIREKIRTHEKQSEEIEKETVEIQAKIKEGRAKLQSLQLEAEKKSLEKQQEVKGDRQGLLERLQVLEKQTEEISQIGPQYTNIEKKNFDNKLSIHLKTTKFPQYTGSLENTASIINKCKEELFKAVSKLNEAKARKQADMRQAEQYDKTFLGILGTNNKLKEEIESTKKAKQAIRSRILEIQGQIKAKKEAKA